MKEFAVELNAVAVPELGTDLELARLSARDRAVAYLELTKPRITFLIVLTSAAGFCLASGKVDYLALMTAMLGIALLSSGIATLNQYMERDLDRLMRRTADRPLPSGKLAPWEALCFGKGLTAGEVYLVYCKPPGGFFGLTVIAGYLFAYTPRKTRSTSSTMVGAFPGAMPPLTAGQRLGTVGVEPGSLCHPLPRAVSALLDA
jgi:protoheme IX farnesyltransferase